MIKKWIQGIVLAISLIMISFLVFTAFSPVAHSEDCITANDFQASYEKYKSDEKNHYYRFTGKTLETVKEFVNKNYDAGFDDSVKGLVISYRDGNETGLVGVYPDDTMNSCATKILQPKTFSIQKLIEFIEGV